MAQPNVGLGVPCHITEKKKLGFFFFFCVELLCFSRQYFQQMQLVEAASKPNSSPANNGHFNQHILLQEQEVKFSCMFHGNKKFDGESHSLKETQLNKATNKNKSALIPHYHLSKIIYISLSYFMACEATRYKCTYRIYMTG